MSKTGKIVAGALVVAVAIIGLFWAVDLRVTDEGELPSAEVDLDVDVDPGRLPDVNVDTVDVDLGTREEQVTVPEVRVTLEEETITVPTIDIDPPNAGDPTDR